MSQKQDVDATQSLAQAIQAGDAVALQQAIDDGASLTQLSGEIPNALAFAIQSIDRHGVSDQTELVNCLLQAGADANDGGINQPVPLLLALGSLTLYPVQARRIAELLVQHGADVSAVSPKSPSGATSPLEAAVISEYEDLVIWLLHHSPRTEVPPILQRIEERIERLAEMAGLEHAESNRQTYRPIIKLLNDFKDEGEVPPMSDANRMLRDRQLKAMANEPVDHNQSADHDQLEQLTASYSIESSELLEGMEVEFVGSFLPSVADVEAMPERISLTSLDSFQWSDSQRHEDATKAFTKHAFKPVGLFQLSGMDHVVLAFVQPFRDIYGMLEQVDENQMFCRLLRMWPGDEFKIVTNEEMSINVDVPGFDYVWKSESAALPVITHYTNPAFNDRTDQPVPATAENFVDHYCRGYQVYRERLIQVLSELEQQR